MIDTADLEDEYLQPAIRLAEYCKYDAPHAWQVTKLALQLFDDLLTLHRLSAEERHLLACAGILHDIGWINGWKNHHKSTLEIILNTKLLPFDSKTRLLIGSIARYHRGALPSLRHAHYAALSDTERQVVSVLAAHLKLADALDETHRQRVKNINCQIKKKKIILECRVIEPSLEEKQACLKKGGLLENVLKHRLVIHWNLTI